MLLYRRRWGLFYLPLLALAVAAIALAARYLFPLPPRSVVLAVGVPQGGYAQMAADYSTELERRGIRVDVLTGTAGGTAPLQRLANPRDPSDAGFAHGLLAERGPEAPVQALAVVGKQPVWVFTHHATLTTLGALRGMEVAAGTVGSATRRVAEQLLAQAQVPAASIEWREVETSAAANDLIERRVDAVILIGSSNSPTVRLLSRSPGIAMLGVERADALASREPRLQPFVLPQGAIELRGNVPPRDLTLLFTGTHLLVRESMHPALQRALLDAATDVHGAPSFLQHQSEYPAFQTDFPLSPVAQTYAHGDRPWLETALPYWWAQLAELLLYAVLPILLAAAAALLWIPQLFSLRVDAVLAHYYGDLKFLEVDIDRVAADQPIALKPLLLRLDQMEKEVAALDLPDRYADRWYTLREHLVTARERLLKLRGR